MKYRKNKDRFITFCPHKRYKALIGIGSPECEKCPEHIAHNPKRLHVTCRVENKYKEGEG